MLVEVNQQVKSNFSNKFIIEVLKQASLCRPFVCWRGGMGGNKKVPDFVSVALVSETTIRKINKKYRRLNRVTDVLSFNDPAEIIICFPKLVRQAKEQKHSQKKEMAFLLIHGWLHILGYEHRTKKQEVLMNKKTQEIISWLQKKKLLK